MICTMVVLISAASIGILAGFFMEWAEEWAEDK